MSKERLNSPSVSNLRTPDEQITRILYDRKRAAEQLSISVATLDRLIAGKRINTRRIGSRVLVPHGELKRFARADHFSVQSSCA